MGPIKSFFASLAFVLTAISLVGFAASSGPDTPASPPIVAEAPATTIAALPFDATTLTLAQADVPPVPEEEMPDEIDPKTSLPPVPQIEPPATSLQGCCQDCICQGNCTCQYPGQCLLRKAGKHILWVHDSQLGSWRGYASPHCKNVAEAWTQQHAAELRKVIVTPPLQNTAPNYRVFRRYTGGSCGPNGCR